jgi:ABC-type multidrug transport system ATPase subunit
VTSKPFWKSSGLEIRGRDGKTYSLEPFEIRAGERVALVGANRDFRRSFFRVLAGLEAALGGGLEIEGEKIALRHERRLWRDLLSKKSRRKIGMSLETEGLLSNVTVRESMETLFRFKYGDHNISLVEGAARVVEETAERVGLTARDLDRRPSDLGALELRLSSLCLAFLTKPAVLMLENPTAGLNDRSWQSLSNSLEQVLEGSQRTLVMDSDDWLLSKFHATRWLVFDGDRVVFDGTPQDHIAQSGRRLLDDLETERFRARSGWIDELRRTLGAA